MYHNRKNHLSSVCKPMFGFSTKYAFHINLICFLAHPYNPTNTHFACKDIRKTERPSWKLGREHFHHPHLVERENHGFRANPYIPSSPYLSRLTYH